MKGDINLFCQQAVKLLTQNVKKNHKTFNFVEKNLKLFRYGNFDVPVQKKNTKKFQVGCHLEQNGF